MMSHDILKRPLVTEKSGIQKEELRQVSFEVDRRANRIEIKKAVEEGDREAQMYLIDRRLGKPKQQAELEVSGEVSVETLVRLLGMIQQRRITGGTDAIQRQIEGQGSSQGTNEKEA